MGHRSAPLLLSILVSVLASAAALADPQLVKDIRSDGPYSSSPRQFAGDGTIVYFVADDENPSALWKTDGTESGTSLLKMLLPPHFASFDDIAPRFTPSGKYTYFFAQGLRFELVLWRTDGTAEGTIPLVTLGDTWNDDISEVAAVASNRFAFTRRQNGAPNTLWISDGTPGGTRLATTADNLFGLTGDGAIAFFLAGTSSTAALWTTDGTEAGTRQIAPIGSSSTIQAVFSRRALLAVDGANRSMDMLLNDGAGAGMTTLLHIDKGYFGGAIAGPDRALFAVYADKFQLWTTDGTAAGTRLLVNGLPGPWLTAKGGVVRGIFVFSTVPQSGTRQLWRSDGTVEGTFVLAEDANGFIPLATGSRHQYFAVASGPNAGLWATDGTVAGTQRITGVTPSAAPGAVIDDTLFFGGDDGTQRELWRSDATQASTRLLKNIANDTDSRPAAFAKLGDILLFHAYDTEHGSELYRTDGTPGGTTLVKDIRPGAASSRPDQVASLGGIALFVADDGMHGRELWRTDGTADGTRLVREINPGGNAFSPYYAPGIVVRDGVGYFAATDGTTSSLWRSDGTDGGTFALKAGGDDPILYDNAIVFASTTGLWRTDGTLAGTTQLTMAACSLPTAVGTKLFFVQGGETWVLDSPAATARLVKDINPNGSSSDGTPFRVALNGLLIFTADDGTHGKELWRSDGTADGTLLLKDIRPGSGDAIVTGISEQPFAVLGSRFYFAANDGVHGAELWSTDGTEAGTRMVADLAPGTTDSWPDDMTVSGGRMWFSAFDPGHGRELWSTTGSELTRYDIVAGPDGSAPGSLYPFAGAVYFNASTPATGSELWKVQTSAPARRRAAR